MCVVFLSTTSFFLNPFVQIKDLARYTKDASRNSCRIPFKVSVSCEGLNFYSGVEKVFKYSRIWPHEDLKKKVFPEIRCSKLFQKWVTVTTISQPRRLGSSACCYFPILTDNEISMYTSKPHRPKFHEYHSSDSVFVTWRISQPKFCHFSLRPHQNSNMLSALVAIESLEPGGYYIHPDFWCLNILHSAHISQLRGFFYGSQNKQRFFFYTA